MSNSDSAPIKEILKKKLKSIINKQIFASGCLIFSTFLGLIFIPYLDKRIAENEKIIVDLIKKSDGAREIEIKNQENMILCEIAQLRSETMKEINPQISKDYEGHTIQEFATIIMQYSKYWRDTLDPEIIRREVDGEIDKIYRNPNYTFLQKRNLLLILSNEKSEAFGKDYNLNNVKIEVNKASLSKIEACKKKTIGLFAIIQVIALILITLYSSKEKLISLEFK